MSLIFSFGIVLGAFVYILNYINGELVMKVNSKSNVGKYYAATRKENREGYEVDDWDYLNCSGDEITDKKQINLIFNSFRYEDWYGEYNFYVNDESFHVVEVVGKNVIVKEAIEEIEDSTRMEHQSN